MTIDDIVATRIIEAQRLSKDNKTEASDEYNRLSALLRARISNQGSKDSVKEQGQLDVVLASIADLALGSAADQIAVLRELVDLRRTRVHLAQNPRLQLTLANAACVLAIQLKKNGQRIEAAPLFEEVLQYWEERLHFEGASIENLTQATATMSRLRNAIDPHTVQAKSLASRELQLRQELLDLTDRAIDCLDRTLLAFLDIRTNILGGGTDEDKALLKDAAVLISELWERQGIWISESGLRNAVLLLDAYNRYSSIAAPLESRLRFAELQAELAKFAIERSASRSPLDLGYLADAYQYVATALEGTQRRDAAVQNLERSIASRREQFVSTPKLLVVSQLCLALRKLDGLYRAEGNTDQVERVAKEAPELMREWNLSLAYRPDQIEFAVLVDAHQIGIQNAIAVGQPQKARALLADLDREVGDLLVRLNEVTNSHDRIRLRSLWRLQEDEFEDLIGLL